MRAIRIKSRILVNLGQFPETPVKQRVNLRSLESESSRNISKRVLHAVSV